jgi:hypothetical protein
LYAAEIVAGWALDEAHTSEEKNAAALFLRQWPEGPQLSAKAEVSE